jgi:hypothetical protein
MESYENDANDFQVLHGFIGVLIMVALANTASVNPWRRTRGANASAFLGHDRKPILMELKNCRVVHPAADSRPEDLSGLSAGPEPRE